MSLITRCPACGTMFKVVPDQLRISEGWVRCGHCAEIFDATASLQGPEATALPVQAPASPPVQAAVPFPVQAAVTEPAPIQQFRETEPPTQAPAPRVPAPSAPIRPAPEPRDAPDSIDAPPLYPSFPSEVHESELEREARHRDEEPDLDSVSFVRKARRKASWRRPLVRAVLLLVALVLAAVLALQYGVQERARLAAMQPALRPWLQLLCGPLRCDIGPPRQIDAIVVDSSSFNRLRSDAYRLSFSLRNQAPMPIAMPSIELTLTDTQDQPVVRRVLAPRDIGAAPVIAGGGETASSVTVAVAANGSSGRIAGYRLLAFYP
jgi:predicted Zn finger-like uncharacterized protein